MTELLSKLSATHEQIAYMEALGQKPMAIAEKVGLNIGSVHRIKADPLYKLFLSEIRREMREKAIATGVDLVERFNVEAPGAADTLFELHREAEKDGDRIKAAVEVLDRSTEAPQPRRIIDNQGEGGLHIHIPGTAMKGIAKALTDTGHEDTLELLEQSPNEFAPEQPVTDQFAPANVPEDQPSDSEVDGPPAAVEMPNPPPGQGHLPNLQPKPVEMIIPINLDELEV